jgi:hypothetical protein
MNKDLRGRYAIVGIDTARCGKVPDGPALAQDIEAIAVNRPRDPVRPALPVRAVHQEFDDDVALVYSEPQGGARCH